MDRAGKWGALALSGHVLALVMAGGMVGRAMAGERAVAERRETELAVGHVCLVADGWWALDRRQPVQAESVRVVKLQPLPSAEPGVWIQPLRGPLQDYHFLIAAKRISDCRR